MSVKSLTQIIIFTLIIFILATVYYKYFNVNKNIVEEKTSLESANQEQLNKLEKKILELELQNNKLVKKIEKTSISKKKEDILEDKIITEKEEIIQDGVVKINDNKIEKNNKIKKIDEKEKKSPEEIKNLVKDIKYNSIDERGNKFYLLANSGKSNKNNKDILDLVNVRGEITSEKRDTIYIVSDFAQFNSVNSNSKFYNNVVINYQDKQITCINFDINMESNKAIAYNNVLITDPKSSMKAGLVEFDLKTKNININPESATTDVKIKTE